MKAKREVASMCQFFSFISNGKGKFWYADAEARRSKAFNSPDSHTELAERLTRFRAPKCDQVNKYEYSNGKFIVDQINAKDDQLLAKDWITKFAKSQAFADICLAAVEQDGWTLKYMPDELRTPALCLTAVKQDGRALEYVPSELITPALCLAAVKQDGRALEYVPSELKTPALCLAAVEQDGWALYYVPNEFKTPALCLAAVKQNGWALEYVPSELVKQTKEALCII